MTDLQSLIERVEKLTGPDREVDAELCLAFSYIGWVENPLNLRRSEDHSNLLDYEADEDGDGHLSGCTDCAPELTASVDAALAFAERVLPGWVLGSIVRAYSAGDDPSPYYCVLVAPGSGGVPGDWSGRIEATADTIPLAIILAALRAKKKEAQNG